ncbi:MAG: NAD-dependent epimerase/dehydratase family protein, partial [Deltaproteobacteria bacterium]|nr:NAD-dependent epimerase/dehydratase family protein [Deltaproteobacteria bacterium]
VTGAAGFIGSHVCQRLASRGDEVTGLDNFDGFYARVIKERNLGELRAALDPTARPGSFDFVEGDIRRPEDLATAFSAARPELVVHLAALAGVRPSIADPTRYAEVNVTGTQRILDACRVHGVSRLAFASSSSVYGLDSAVPFREGDTCLRPVSPYAATKRAGELVNFTAHHLTGLGVTNLRFFTVYGPRQRPDLAIHKFTRLISNGQPIELFGDGSTSRDYTWIYDIVDGCLASIDQLAADVAGTYRIYNLGGSQTTTLMELVDMIATALGRRPEIAWLAEQPGDMKRTLADVTLSNRDLGYQPRVPIGEGIKRFVAWYRGANA